MGDNPFALLDDAVHDRDTWRLPSFAPSDERIRLEPDETVLHILQPSQVEIMTKLAGDTGWTKVWSSDRPCTTVFTDRRVGVGSRSFDQGSTYSGSGVAGALIGLGLTAVSRHGAKARTAGVCFGGHLRYEWVAAVGYRLEQAGSATRTLAALVDVPLANVVVVAWDRPRRWRLDVGSVKGPPTPPEVAETVAAAVIGRRLSRVDLLDPVHVETLRRKWAGVCLRPEAGHAEVIAIDDPVPFDVQPKQALSEPPQ